MFIIIPTIILKVRRFLITLNNKVELGHFYFLHEDIDECKFIFAFEKTIDALKKNGGYDAECEAILNFMK